jgi:hypothetical protein
LKAARKGGLVDGSDQKKEVETEVEGNGEGGKKGRKKEETDSWEKRRYLGLSSAESGK